MPITTNGNEEMETAMIINILPQTKANVVVASVEDKLKILASCNVVEDTYNLKLVSGKISRGVERSWLFG